MDNKLKELISLCKCSIELHIDEHQHHSSIYTYLNVINKLHINAPHTIIDKCVELNTVIEIYVYPPDKSIGYSVMHYDIDMAIDEMIRLIKDNQ